MKESKLFRINRHFLLLPLFIGCIIYCAISKCIIEPAHNRKNKSKKVKIS